MMGRPKSEFDWELFDKLCSFPPVFTQQDIVECMKVSLDTCVKNLRQKHGEKLTLSEYREQKAGTFRRIILASQIEAARKGNVSMLIWLGKNYLQQKEPKSEQVVTIEDNDKIAREYATQLKKLGFKDEPTPDSG